MRKVFFIFTILILSITGIKAQELQCMVQISSPGMSETDRQILQTLQSSIYEFMNQRNWTEYQYKPEERIEASILITINEKVGSDEYRGTIQVQSRRPIFQTSYSSPIINHNDRDLSFRYVENQTLEYADNTFTSNLTSVLAFYANLIIGFDFDTFSPMGGTPYFEKAQNIVNLAQNAPERGWKSFEGQRNRYWLMENIFNSQYSNIRQALYTYHRLGFDRMTDNMDMARSEVVNAIEMFQRVHRQRPGSYLMSIIMTTKGDELVNLFTEAPAMEKNQVVQILTEIDPANSARYRRITQPRN
ncbi:MAG: DUF4835 family protein [Bacteroidales bacterium]|nr:DUF4835 family protein [Bacteroidales bacterium]